MSPNSIHAGRARTRLVVRCGLTIGLTILAHTAEAQSPPSFIIYDDGTTRTNVGSTDSQIILRDNPNPPPNPTTVILSDGFSLGQFGRAYYYKLENSSVLDVRGGMLEQQIYAGVVDLYDTSRLLMSGGSIRYLSSQSFNDNDPAIRAGGSSRAEISGGRFQVNGNSGEGGNGPGIVLRENAVLDISGGAFGSSNTTIMVSEGASHVTISDGSFGATGDRVGSILAARGSSVVDVLGGTFTSDNSNSGIGAFGDAVINVRGGSFNFPFITLLRTGFNGASGGSGRIKVFGDNFALDGSHVGPGFIPFDGRLTGVLADGTPLDVLATGRVFLVPEPAAWLLAAVALAWPTRRSRRQ